MLYRARPAGEHFARVQVEQDASVGEVGRVAEDPACEIAQRGVGGVRRESKVEEDRWLTLMVRDDRRFRIAG